jgi:hypothetical protein
MLPPLESTRTGEGPFAHIRRVSRSPSPKAIHSCFERRLRFINRTGPDGGQLTFGRETAPDSRPRSQGGDVSEGHGLQSRSSRWIRQFKVLSLDSSLRLVSSPQRRSREPWSGRWRSPGRRGHRPRPRIQRRLLLPRSPLR